MATPGQAVSTGQGRGEAQVFQPLKNDYYKNKANLALKEKDAMKKAQLEIGSAPIWNRDLGLFNEKRQKIQTFAKENQRALLEGDFDKQLEFEQLKSDALQFANSSNTKMKEWQTTDKMIKSNPNKYYGKSVDEHNAFSGDAGNFGNYGVRERFDKNAFLDNEVSKIGKLGYDYSDLKVQEVIGADGKAVKMIVNQAGQPVQALNQIIKSDLSGASQAYGEDQISESISEQEMFDYLEPFLGQKKSASQVSDSYSKKYPGKDANYGWDFSSKSFASNIPFGDADNMTLEPDQVLIFGGLQLPTGIRTQLSSNNRFMPMSGKFMHGSGEDAKEIEIIPGVAWSTEKEQSARNYAAGITDMDIASVKVAPVFQKGATGIKNQDLQLEGRLVPAEFLDDNGMLKEFYFPKGGGDKVNLREKFGGKIKYEGRAFLQSGKKTSGHVPVAEVNNALLKYPPWDEGAKAEMERKLKEMNAKLSGQSKNKPVSSAEARFTPEQEKEISKLVEEAQAKPKYKGKTPEQLRAAIVAQITK